MSKKILISEDFQSVSSSITLALKKYNNTIAHSYFCDETYNKIKKSIQDNDPYDLLILDLKYTNTPPNSKLESGEDLMYALKKESIDIKTLVFSIEDRPQRIKFLFNTYNISGFITKGIHDLKELEEAFDKIFKGEIYEPSCIRFEPQYTYEMEHNDIPFLERLNIGDSMDEIELYFKNHNYKPYSKSHLNKRLMALKVTFSAKNTRELLNICREKGII